MMERPRNADRADIEAFAAHMTVEQRLRLLEMIVEQHLTAGVYLLARQDAIRKMHGPSCLCRVCYPSHEEPRA